MAIAPYLAMTATEFGRNPHIGSPMAWMAPCHCAPWTNLPDMLPKGSLLAVTDQLSIDDQDIPSLCSALSAAVFHFGCHGVLLDFQHPGSQEALPFAQQLIQALPCPVAVSELYAKDLDCPVFLSPVPPDCPLSDSIAPWQGREIWLDLSTEGIEIMLTSEGSTNKPLPHFVPSVPGYAEKVLHCHYAISVDKASAVFTLWRAKEDLQALLCEAETLGISKVIGLYQELGHII